MGLCLDKVRLPIVPVSENTQICIRDIVTVFAGTGSNRVII